VWGLCTLRVLRCACCASEAQQLGLRVLRTWAYSDGTKEWNGIQPQLGVLNETILSQALN
jgi:hypothetical protein